MSDDFSSGIDQWDLRRVDPGKDGHTVRVNDQGQLVIDSSLVVSSGNGAAS